MNAHALQRALQALGLYRGAIDGKIGPLSHAAIRALLERNDARVQSGWRRWGAARCRVAGEQLVMWSAGIEVGAIDGLVGPQTMFAYDAYRRHLEGLAPDTARDEIMQPRVDDARFPEPVKTVWPRQPDVVRHYGEVGQNQALLHLPFKMRLAWDLRTPVNRFSIHEKAHDSAARIFRRILSHYGEAEIVRLHLDRFGGCLNVRRMRGGSAWSMHSWGIAIDIDPARNQLNWNRARAHLAKPEYDAFWRFWTEEGWLSLGKARDFDWMHVQAARL